MQKPHGTSSLHMAGKRLKGENEKLFGLDLVNHRNRTKLN